MTTAFVESCVQTAEGSARSALRFARGKPHARKLLKLLANKKRILITTHAHPDPDAERLAAYEPEIPVEVREWIAPALASPALVLEPQPPAQPHSHVCVERAIRLAGGADAEVIGPPAEHAVQLVYELSGVLPGTRPDGQRVDSFDHALDALL